MNSLADAKVAEVLEHLHREADGVDGCGDRQGVELAVHGVANVRVASGLGDRFDARVDEPVVLQQLLQLTSVWETAWPGHRLTDFFAEELPDRSGHRGHRGVVVQVPPDSDDQPSSWP